MPEQRARNNSDKQFGNNIGIHGCQSGVGACVHRSRRNVSANAGIYVRKLFNERTEIETSNCLSRSRRGKRKEENVLVTLTTLH